MADDYYQIASESKYNYSKSETGKNKPTHDGVREWHYFVNDIYFAEYDSNVYKPYTVSINVFLMITIRLMRWLLTVKEKLPLTSKDCATN